METVEKKVWCMSRVLTTIQPQMVYLGLAEGEFNCIVTVPNYFEMRAVRIVQLPIVWKIKELKNKALTLVWEIL